VTPLGRGRYALERNGRRTRAYAARVGSAVWVFLDGRVHVVANEPEAVAAGHADAPGSLSAPMPATVVAVDVVPGQAVAAGDTLVRLEAMKMEWPLAAPRAGVVRAVRCAIGDLVQPGEPLVELE
jgi:3-methylcrotonyl-CoA carboxylase alpha subunit